MSNSARYTPVLNRIPKDEIAKVDRMENIAMFGYSTTIGRLENCQLCQLSQQK